MAAAPADASARSSVYRISMGVGREGGGLAAPEEDQRRLVRPVVRHAGAREELRVRRQRRARLLLRLGQPEVQHGPARQPLSDRRRRVDVADVRPRRGDVDAQQGAGHVDGGGERHLLHRRAK